MSSNLLQLNRSGSLFLLDNSAEVDVCGTIISDVVANDSGQFLEGDLAASSVGLAIVNSPASDNLVSGQANAGRGGRHIDPPQLSGNCNISKQGGSRGTILVEMSVDSLQLNGLGLFLVSLKGVADESLTIKLATGIGVHLAIEHRISTIQNRGTLNIGIPLTAVSRRCLRSNFVFVQNILHRFFIALIKSDNDFTMRCKRCKRYAHDNHEHSRQQSKQTSFEVRFLHVNFSYSLKFI